MKVEIQAHPNLASYISLALNMAANLKTGFFSRPQPFFMWSKETEGTMKQWWAQAVDDWLGWVASQQPDAIACFANNVSLQGYLWQPKLLYDRGKALEGHDCPLWRLQGFFSTESARKQRHSVMACSPFWKQITQNFEKPTIDRNKKATWSSFYNLYPSHGMLLQHWGIGHAPFLWELAASARKSPLWTCCFRELWDHGTGWFE